MESCWNIQRKRRDVCPIRANGEVNQKSVGGKIFLDISVQGNIIIIEKKILFTEIR